ncbi:unnamed protein product [Amoebophrya sp. A120]|nr:unnamed protein product [Amoebophrya sp. A120]|eukprot:GSA120T00003245001.1
MVEYDFAETEKVLKAKQAAVDERIAEVRFLCRRAEAGDRGFYKNLLAGRVVAAPGEDQKSYSAEYCKFGIKLGRRTRLKEVFPLFGVKNPLTNQNHLPLPGTLEQYVADEIVAAAKCRPYGGTGFDADPSSDSEGTDHKDDENRGGAPSRVIKPGAATNPIAYDFSINTHSLFNFVKEADKKQMDDAKLKLSAALTEKDRVAKNIKDIQDNNFECAVCISSSREERFPVLVMLGCCHVFCFDCADKFINGVDGGQNQNANNDDHVRKCPTCRAAIDEESTARIPPQLFCKRRRVLAVGGSGEGEGG